MSLSAPEKIRDFYAYIKDSIKAKEVERAQPGLSDDNRYMLKMEIAELEVVRIKFEKCFSEHLSDPLENFMMSTLILTKDQLAAIGSVAIESTYCEKLVEEIIWNLAGLDEDKGKFFTQPIQLSNRLELLSDLGKQKLSDQKEIENFRIIISDLKIATSNRNTIIHGHWSWSETSKDFFTLWREGPEKQPPAAASKRRLKNDPVTFSAADIQDVAVKISRLTAELNSFYLKTLQKFP
jgi:hypothetical protein